MQNGIDDDDLWGEGDDGDDRAPAQKRGLAAGTHCAEEKAHREEWDRLVESALSSQLPVAAVPVAEVRVQTTEDTAVEEATPDAHTEAALAPPPHSETAVPGRRQEEVGMFWACQQCNKCLEFECGRQDPSICRGCGCPQLSHVPQASDSDSCSDASSWEDSDPDDEDQQ